MFTHNEIDTADTATLRRYAGDIGVKGRSRLGAADLRRLLRSYLDPRDPTPVPLFVELCAGTAAVSLRLDREGAKPPVSRMGAKTGYSTAILHALGLYPGQRADRYVWCEPDAGARLLLEAYRDEGLARQAAEIIRGWKDEDPRVLWERLRAEGPPKGADAAEIARVAFVRGGSMKGFGEGYFGGNAAGWEGTAHGAGTKRPLVERLPDALYKVDQIPATIAEDARTVDPREVARWAWVQGHGDISKPPRLAKPYRYPEGDANGSWKAPPRDWLARRIETIPTLPATIAEDARILHPPILPPGTVVYIDPPYVGTTGYSHDLPREDVVTLARRWHEAGATVAISEAEPIQELVSDGWEVVDITSQRVGAKRTFSRQQREYLTIGRFDAST